MAVTSNPIKSVLQILTDVGTTATGATKTSTQSFSVGVKTGAANDSAAAAAWYAIVAAMVPVLDNDLVDVRGVLTSGYAEE